MWRMRCVLGLLLLVWLVWPVYAQKLTGRTGRPEAKTYFITAEIRDEGTFELQRAVVLTNWATLTNFNSFPATNTYVDARTNQQRFYRLVRLTIPPVLTQQPAGLTNIINQEVRLEAGATGSWPLRFQWYRNGQPVPGATSNKLVFSGSVNLSGSYNLLVSNLWGVALTTPVAVKTVNPVAASIAGEKIRYVIKGAQGGFLTSGNFETTYNAQRFYNTTGSSVFLNDAGNWQYGVFNGQNIGRVLMTGSITYGTAAIDLTFTNETSGTYNLQVENQAGRQFGDFTFVD